MDCKLNIRFGNSRNFVITVSILVDCFNQEVKTKTSFGVLLVNFFVGIVREPFLKHIYEKMMPKNFSTTKLIPLEEMYSTPSS